MSCQEKNIMNKEIQITAAGKQTTVYMHSTCLSKGKETTPPHRHSASEIHIVIEGSADFFIGENHTVLCAGQFILIPKNTFHYRTFLTDNTRLCTFETDLDSECLVFSISTVTLEDMCRAIRDFQSGSNGALMSAYLTLICSHFINAALNIQDIIDREYLIEKFFQKNYNKDVTLQDLAKTLCLSEKQSERLIKKLTGNSFRQELSKRRIEAAIDLIKSENIPLCKVAEIVGYKSYSGFWKAYKAYIQH